MSTDTDALIQTVRAGFHDATRKHAGAALDSLAAELEARTKQRDRYRHAHAELEAELERLRKDDEWIKGQLERFDSLPSVPGDPFAAGVEKLGLRAVAAKAELERVRGAADTTIRKMGEALDNAHQKARDMEAELERVKAERDEAGRAGAERTVRASKRANEAEARLDKALMALWRIVACEWQDAKVENLVLIARSALEEVLP